MADSSLQVKITADVTSLQAKAAVAKVELTELNSSVKSLASEFVEASDEMKASLAPQLDAMAQKAAAAKVELAALNAEIKEQAASAGANMFAQLAAGIVETTESIEGMTEKLAVFQRLTTAVGEFVFAGLAVEQVSEAINHVAETGEGLEKLSEETGLTTEQLSGLRVIARETGTDFDQFTTLVQRLPNTLQEAATGNGKAADAFRAMGIQVTDANGQIKPMGDILDQVSAKLASYADGANKTALETDIFGSKIGASLIPMLNELGQIGLAGAIVQSDRLNQTWTGETAEAAEQYEDDMHRATLATEGIADAIVRFVLPALDALANQLAPSLDAQISTTESQLQVLNGRGLAMKGILEARLKDLEAQKAQIDQSITAQQATAGGAAVGSVEAPSIDGSSGVGGHQGAGGDDPALNGLKTDESGVSGGGDDGSARVSAARSTQEQVTQIAQDAAQARDQIATAEYQAQVSNWGAEVAQGKLTKAAEIQDEISAQNQMYEAKLQEMQKEAALDTAGTAAKAKALDDIQVLTAQHNEALAELNAQLVSQQVEDAQRVAEAQKEAAEQAQQAWQRAVQPIETAFDGMLNGVLQGTQTLRGAEVKAAQDITLAFIDAEAKKALSFAAGEAQILARGVMTETGLTAATVAGNSARIADKTASNAISKALTATDATTTISASAGKAAAESYAAMAGIPYVGPILGAAAAAAAFTAVLAYDVLSAEGGLALGPGMNPLVQLHENEMVLPAHIAQPLTAMAMGNTTTNQGGDTYNGGINFNLTASGGKGGNSAGDVLSVLNAAVRGGQLQGYPALARMMRRGN